VDRCRELESLRFLFEVGSSRFVEEVLATRGDRLALFRGRVVGTGSDTGPSEVDFLQVTETDDRGDAVAIVTFDPDDLDAAYAELDERYAAGEADPHAAAWQTYLRLWRALAARDWKQLAATFAPDFLIEDHRPVGLFASFSRDEWVASARALFDLRPDATVRLAHVLAIDDCRALTVGWWAGGEPEGAFETPTVVVRTIARDGTRFWHIYDPDQLDEARACYDALRPDPLCIPPNAATRAFDRFWECIETQDWEALAALCVSIVWEDRRRLIRSS